MSQPCFEHTTLANQIFASRGGFKKHNTVVVLIAALQQSSPDSGTLLGFAHFPWMQNNGLIVVIPYTMAQEIDNTISHEIGHSLGLWHIFRGSSEVYTENNTCPANPVAECYENDNSDVSGDFCDDTGPFPNTMNMTTCGAPSIVDYPDYCNSSRTAWSTLNTQNNYMGYIPATCQTAFSPKQMRRMRCYVDRMGYPTGIAPASSSFSRPLTSANSTRGQTSGTPLDPKPVGAAAQFSFIFAVLLTFVFCFAL